MTGAVSLKCIVCGQSDEVKFWGKAQDVEYFVDSEWYEFFECQRCRALQISPIPLQRLAEIYPKNYYSFAAGKKSIVTSVKEFFDKRFFRKLLKEMPSTSINVLDVGGGTGWLLDLIRSVDSRVSITQVVDISPEAAPIATSKGHRYFLGTIEQFISADKFDVALLLNLIEHVQNPEAVLQSMCDRLSERGIIVIKTPNYDSLDARIFRNRSWGGLHCPRHWHIFTKDSIVTIARRCGLRLRAFRYTQGAPFWAVSGMSVLLSKGLVSLGQDRPAFRHPLFSLFLICGAMLDSFRRPFSKTSQMFLVLEKSGIDQ